MRGILRDEPAGELPKSSAKLAIISLSAKPKPDLFSDLFSEAPPVVGYFGGIAYLCGIINDFKFRPAMAKENIKLHADCLADAQIPDYAAQCPPAPEGELRMLSLFSGCGGMDLGFEGGFICHRRSVPEGSPWIQEGVNGDWVLLRRNRFSTVFANDILREAKIAWANYMERFGKDPAIYRFKSIVDLVKKHQENEKLIAAGTPRDEVEAVFPENIDLVTGGFPCQDFSVAGKRAGFDSGKMHDGSKREGDVPSEETRGKLYFWMKQVIDIVKPKVFVAENVKGLVSLGEAKEIIQRDFSGADGNGYIVLDPQVLHAGDYGVPETRERVIFIGIRKSALRPEVRAEYERTGELPANPYPAPTHSHTGSAPGLLQPVSCREVFASLLEPEKSADLSQRNYSRAKYMGSHCQGQSEIAIDGLGPTIRSEHHGNIEYRRLSAEHGGAMADELARGLAERRMTPRECALIQTFPPDYTFVTPASEGSAKFGLSPSGAYKVIGNAVPPMLAYNIARRLQEVWPLYFG